MWSYWQVPQCTCLIQILFCVLNDVPVNKMLEMAQPTQNSAGAWRRLESQDIDVSLYTANTDEDKECQEPVMRCFFLEMKVILHECNIKKCSRTQDVLNIWKNGNARFETNQLNSTSKKCKECEEYEEKNFTEFIQSFVKVIQRECKYSSWEQ
ncbi:interleukin-15 isoform X6 [Coturnix japonica]|uniref:interleukin-15 isoform X6 n=1 Tax=Coturnix japonica TaxID=93934 RepID=UPI000776C343|nr:interleukin-15 isoform X6 [Coturnix japonica]